jgi:hypothetical protein
MGMGAQVEGRQRQPRAAAASRTNFALAMLFAIFHPRAAAADPPKPDGVSETPQESTWRTAASKEAEGHFKRARELFDEGDYSLALFEFQRAYDVLPNYRVLYNVAQVEIQLFHYAAARIALQRFLDDGKSEIPPERRARAENDLHMLAERTSLLRVVTTPPADVSIDDGLPIAAPFTTPLLVNAGERKVVVSRAGYLTASRTVTLAGGDQKELNIELVPIPEAPPPVVVVPAPARSRPNYAPATIAWVGTAALTIGAGVAGGIYLGEQGEIDNLSDPSREVSRQSADAASSRARRVAVTADVLGLAAVGTGLVALYLTLHPPEVEAPRSTTVVLRPTPTGLMGTF